MGFPFSQHLTVFFCIVPSDYKRFVRFQWKDNNRICYFSEKNPYSYALKIKEKKKKNFSRRVFYSQTLCIRNHLLYIHPIVFGTLICVALWTTKCRTGDDKDHHQGHLLGHHFFLHLRQALHLTSLKRPFQFISPLPFHSGMGHREEASSSEF